MTFQPKINKDKYYKAAKTRSEKTIQNEFVEVEEQVLRDKMQSGLDKGKLANQQKKTAVPNMKPMQRDAFELPPEYRALREIFDTLDNDRAGRISIETAAYTQLSAKVLEVISPILFSLEIQGSMNFEDFCEQAYKENAVTKIKEIFGIRDSYDSKLSDRGREDDTFGLAPVMHRESHYDSNDSKGGPMSHHSSENSEGSTQRFGTLPTQQQENPHKMKNLTKKYQEVARKSFASKS